MKCEASNGNGEPTSKAINFITSKSTYSQCIIAPKLLLGIPALGGLDITETSFGNGEIGCLVKRTYLTCSDNGAWSDQAQYEANGIIDGWEYYESEGMGKGLRARYEYFSDGNFLRKIVCLTRKPYNRG